MTADLPAAIAVIATEPQYVDKPREGHQREVRAKHEGDTERGRSLAGLIATTLCLLREPICSASRHVDLPSNSLRLLGTGVRGSFYPRFLRRYSGTALRHAGDLLAA
ncbi:MAG: hypothetical protein KAX84_09005 [Burkholderiales bacterium]|nr:hypothetical protein [Burkholderiales bacterium]